jgi:Resolvase, N terminal domain
MERPALQRLLEDIKAGKARIVVVYKVDRLTRSLADFAKIVDVLDERSLAVGAEAPSLLAGLIVDADGNRMTPTHATKKAKRYRYYVSASLLTGDRPQTRPARFRSSLSTRSIG